MSITHYSKVTYIFFVDYRNNSEENNKEEKNNDADAVSSQSGEATVAEENDGN